MLRVKHIRNARDGNGIAIDGDCYHIIEGGLLGGSTGHRLWEASTTKSYELGTRLTTPDGRVFKYAKAGATLVPNFGCQNYNTQCVAYANIAHVVAQYSKTITLDVAVTDGAAGDGAIAKNELRGGYFIIFPHDDNAINGMILTNTAIAAGGGEMTITVDIEMPTALTVDTDDIELMASPYEDVRSTNSDTKSIVGVPSVPATVGQYCWLQTWGPCWISPQAGAGAGAHDRQVVFRHDGSLDEHDYSDAYTAKQQHAGFVLANAAGAGQGAPFIMLQISI